ncbi:protein SHQ1 homolog [Linepithema humile]|uniref:protein SHQ1 homolog n=1 Tax=Linepithema humile TaxID=83485 RepID=UPI000623A7A3|nr:PREDICTED: protein SHQ1 homolog [Linepithema humile]
MLIPRFNITQTDTTVTITIHAPFAKVKNTEIHVDKTDFIFSASPYFLRLQLPGEIVENDSSTGSYVCEKGEFTLNFSKVKEGEHFENLDMISIFLAPSKKKTNIVSNIEVIGNPSASTADIDESLNDNNILDNNPDNILPLPQNNPTENKIMITNYSKYGFANKVSGVLVPYEAAWIKDIIDLLNPDTTPEVERKSLQDKREKEDFSEQHYMADLMQPEFESCLTYTAEWDTLQKVDIAFNRSEVDLLKELPNKEYLLDAAEDQKLCLNLFDILFASCYNHRTTLGENTVESSWTINKLSSTLSWFQTFTSIDEVITACFRRSLCYPLFRSWELSVKIFEDVKKVFALGKKYIIKRFCEIYELFNNSYEPRYILNELYIKHFLIWLQKSPKSLIDSFHSILNDKTPPNKASLGLELVELETAAYSVQEEEEGLVIENNHKIAVNEIAQQIDELSLTNIEKKRLSSGSSSTDSSDSETESSTTSSTTTTSSTSTLDSDDLSDPE